MPDVSTVFDRPVYGEVRESSELTRILHLPKRDPREIGAAIAEPLTALLRKPGGQMSLWPMQALALAEASDFGGAVVLLAVGKGKTLVTYLLPRLMARYGHRPVLLVRAALLQKTLKDFASLEKHWITDPYTSILTYEAVSRDPELLNATAPDLIIADEAHKLKNPKAAVTRRVYRYLKNHNGVGFVALSGTLAQRSFTDYHHLQQWALPSDLQPLPRDYNQITAWSEALDSKLPERRGLGALSVFGETVETARKSYGKLLEQTPGVILDTQNDVRASLQITFVAHRDSEIDNAIARMRKAWATPSGVEFVEAVDLWRHARTLANGFYYEWEPRPSEAWLLARSAFARFVRAKLAHSRTYDTAAQIVDAFGAAPEVRRWKEIEPTERPATVARWLSMSVLTLAHNWILEHEKGLVWVEHRAVGERLERYCGTPFYSEQGLNSKGSHIDDQEEAAIVSVNAIGEGFNLQRFHENLVLNCTPLGSRWEQMIGRTHRNGQEADTVFFDVLLACQEQREGFEQACRDSEYVQQTTGAAQKLCFADIINSESERDRENER